MKFIISVTDSSGSVQKSWESTYASECSLHYDMAQSFRAELKHLSESIGESIGENIDLSVAGSTIKWLRTLFKA